MTLTKPATEDETRGVISALLSLVQDEQLVDPNLPPTIPIDSTPENTLENIVSPTVEMPKQHTVPVEVNVIIKNQPKPQPMEIVIRTAIKELNESSESIEVEEKPKPKKRIS